MLRVVHTPDPACAGKSYDLSEPSTWTLGRSATTTITDGRLSRQHCRLTRVSGGVRVEDLGSRNGCFVEGRQVQQDYLIPNKLLRIGDTLLLLDEEPDADQKAPPNALDSPVPEFAGNSFATESVRRWLATAGPTGATVLLRGATGTGKEVAARALHRLSGRKGEFVAVNCGAIPVDVAEAELFGHRKGAFTGAGDTRPGLFVAAQGGTLFLDEVGDLPPQVQVKLLRVLEERTVRPVGDEKSRDIDVRVLAATNVNLESSGFRSDLLSRLSPWVIELRPLAERRCDILPLAQVLTRRVTRDRITPLWTAEFAEALLLHDWPSNVRELANLIARLAALPAAPDGYDLPDLPAAMQRPFAERDGAAPTDGAPGRGELEAALRAAQGNVAVVAEKYGRARAQVYRWLKRHGVDPEAFRS